MALLPGIRLTSSRKHPGLHVADIVDKLWEWVVACADLWRQLEQHVQCGCVLRELEQLSYEFQLEHRVPLRSTLNARIGMLTNLPAVRGDKGIHFHSANSAEKNGIFLTVDMTAGERTSAETGSNIFMKHVKRRNKKQKKQYENQKSF